MIRIGLSGITFNSINYGVSALAISEVSLINNFAASQNIDVEYYVFSTDCLNQDAALKICNLIGVKKIKFFSSARFKTGFKGIRVLKERMKECAFIFDMTKGDSFSDIYGLKRFILQSVEKRIAIKQSRLIISPQTIGPFRNFFVKKEARFAIKHADYVFCRDDRSLECAKELCPNKTIYKTSDLAFHLPFAKSEKISRTINKLCIGLNISGLLWNGGYTGKNEFGLLFDYKQFIFELLDLLKKMNCEVYLIGHVFMEGGDDDFTACLEVQKKAKHVNLCPKFNDPVEAKSFMSSLDLVIGARMHATIGAISSGVPVLPFSYSRKFEGLYESIGYNYVIKARDWNLQSCLEFVKKSIINIESLKKESINAVKSAFAQNSTFISFVEKILIEALEDEKRKSD